MHRSGHRRGRQRFQGNRHQATFDHADRILNVPGAVDVDQNGREHSKCRPDQENDRDEIDREAGVDQVLDESGPKIRGQGEVITQRCQQSLLILWLKSRLVIETTNVCRRIRESRE